MIDAPDPTAKSLAAHVGREVRAARNGRDWTSADLARAAGLSKTIVGRIEAGEGNPSLETLWRLSRALELPLTALLEPPTASLIRLIPAGSGDALTADSGLVGRVMHAGAARHVELIDNRFPAATDHRSDAHLPGTEEVVTCHAGRLTVGPIGHEQELGPGDALWFRGDVAHRYATADEAAVTSCLMLYATAPR